MKLIYYPHPALRTRAEPVEEITEEIHQLAKAMIHACEEHDGIGLGANQVGVPKRVIITKLDEPCVYINPKLSNPSDETEILLEGNLSMPGIQVPVERPIRITITATDLEGNRVDKTLEGLEARVVMHENDHLNGVLIIDRTDEKSRKAAKAQLRKHNASTNTSSRE